MWRVWRAARGDDDLIVALERDAFGARSWGEKSMRASLDAVREPVLLVGEHDKAPAGFAMWRALGEDAELLAIAVLAPARRRGAGARLLERVLDEARRRGAKRLLLDVDAGNTGARALYRRTGFEVLSRRRRYYRDGADAVVMQAAL